MERRTFISSLTTVALVAARRTTEAQQAKRLPTVGYLGTAQARGDNEYFDAFLQGLREVGRIEGAGMLIEYRSAEGKPERLPGLVAELLALKPDVLLAANPYAIKAIRGATTTVPVVGLDLESDWVVAGLAASVAHPGGHLTGIFLDLPEMSAKLVQLLNEVVPKSRRIAVLWDAPLASLQFRAVADACRAAGVALQSLPVKGSDELDGAFTSAVRQRANGLIVLSSPVVIQGQRRIAEMALKDRLPGIGLFRSLSEVGLLMAYGPNLHDMYRRAATFVDKILSGAKPGDLPIERPAKFDLVINLKTAKALGLTIPPSVLLRADQMIE